jgi:hypothetical protein
VKALFKRLACVAMVVRLSVACGKLLENHGFYARIIHENG